VIGDPQTPIDPGNSGISFSGSIGDGVSTRLVGSPNPHVQSFALTPTSYFYAGARDNVNAVFRSVSGQLLVVRLYVNGALRQTSSGTEDVVIREDL
jgi:sporulation-control protein spo0M